MKIEINSVQSDQQIRSVAQLAEAIWTEHYTPIIGSQQCQYMIENFQSVPAISQQIQDNYQYYLIAKEQEPAGYFSLQPREDSILFLSKVYILSTERGGGLGSQCLQFVKDRARELKLNKIVLTVNINNQVAIAAYEKWGFQRTRSVVADIGEGFVMDDWEYQLAV